MGESSDNGELLDRPGGSVKATSSKQRHREFRATGIDPQSAEIVAAPVTAQRKLRDPAKRKRYLRDYINWLWPYRWALAGIFVMAVLTAALDMVWPVMLKGVVDMLPANLPSDAKAHQLRIFGLTIIALLAGKQGLDTLRSWRLSVLNARVVFRLRKRLFEKLLGLSLSELSEMKAGGITSRLSGDIDSVSGLVNLAVINPAVAIIRVILTIAIVLIRSPRLAVKSRPLLPPLPARSCGW